MDAPVPSLLSFSSNLVQVFLLASQAHLFVFLRRRYGLSAALPAVVAGMFLLLFGDMFLFDIKVLGAKSREPGVWRLWTSVWTAGSFGAYVLYWAWRAFRALTPRSFPASTDIGRRRLLAAGARAALAAPFAVAGYGTFIGRDRFHVREIDLAVPDLPSDLEGLRLTQITDLHSGPYLTPADVSRIVDMANETRPHLALVTGDLISWKGDPVEACIDALSKLRADSGVWGCMGNHETYAEALRFTQNHGARRGLRFLRGENAELRFGEARLNLAGVDYQRSDRPYLAGPKSLTVPGAVNILLSHNPDVFPRAVELGYDVVLSGHTHGGQVTLEIVKQSINPGRFFTPYVVGEYHLGRSVIYVSPGLGTINLPMRIGAQPEISAIRLRQA